MASSSLDAKDDKMQPLRDAGAGEATKREGEQEGVAGDDDKQETKEFEKQIKPLLRDQQQQQQQQQQEEMTMLSPSAKDDNNKKPNRCIQQQQRHSLNSLVDSILPSIQELPNLSRGTAINTITAASTPGAHAVGGPPRGGVRPIIPHPTTRAEESIVESPRSSTMAPIQSLNATLADDDDDDDGGGGGDLVVVDEETGGLAAAGEETTNNTDFSCIISHNAEFQEVVVLEGKPMTTNSTARSGNSKRGWFLVLGCLVVGVAILFLVLGMVASPEEEETSPPSELPLLHNGDNEEIILSSFPENEEGTNLSNPLAPSSLHDNNNNNNNFLQQLQPFDDNLPEMVSTAILDDPESSFYKANQWLLSDPNYDTYTTQRKLQKFYMAMMYYATNGDTWLNNAHWLSYNVSECQWFSQSSFSPDSPYYEPNVCNQEDGTIINLSLANNNLTGSFPIWYSSFAPHIKILDIGYNNIGGRFPPITTPETQEILVVCRNPFVDAVSISGRLDNLKVLRSDGTLLRGNNGGALAYITPNLELGNFTQQPHLGGQIWPSLGILQHLQYLGQGHREGTIGSLPTELGLATSLREADFSSLPELNGTIPSELGLLTHLTRLDLSDTPVTGTVPTELCRMVEEGLLELLIDCGNATEFNNNTLECCEL